MIINLPLRTYNRLLKAAKQRDELLEELEKIQEWFEDHDENIEIHNGSVVLFPTAEDAQTAIKVAIQDTVDGFLLRT